MTQMLREVYHFGTRVLFWLEFENLGKEPITAVCPSCKAEREHFARMMPTGKHYAVCRTCGCGSEIVEEYAHD